MDEIIIRPGHAEKRYWRDLWRYRELFYFLAWRDILVRYKQTVVGVGWAIIRPLLTMLVFTVVFGRLAKLPSGGVPYPILVFAGLLPWQFFSSALLDSSMSLVANGNMLKKVFFPRLIVPVSSVLVSLVDFLIAAGLLAIMMIIYGVIPSWKILLLPLFLGIAFLASMGMGLWLGAFNVKYRDFRYLVPFFLQLAIYISPVGFSSNIVPGQWRLLYSLNPMVTVIDGFRWAILGNEFAIYWPGMFLSTGLAAVILYSGIRHFRRVERTFADVI